MQRALVGHRGAAREAKTCGCCGQYASLLVACAAAQQQPPPAGVEGLGGAAAGGRAYIWHSRRSGGLQTYFDTISGAGVSHVVMLRRARAAMCLLLLFGCGPVFAAAPSCGGTFADCVQPPLLPDDKPQFSGRVAVSLPSAGVSGQMAYWLVPSTLTDPATSPIVVVLEGGPGFASQLQAANGCGPYMITADGTSLSRAEWAWSSNATLLFIDQPLGVGYSTMDQGSAQTTSSEDNAQLMMQLLAALFGSGGGALHPELSPGAANGRQLFVFGHSYGGRTAPALAEAWLSQHSSGLLSANALEGLILGDALVDISLQAPSIPTFLHANGLMSDATLVAAHRTVAAVRGNATLGTARALSHAADLFYRELLTLLASVTPMQFVDQYNIHCH